jgi:hypothetical protein
MNAHTCIIHVAVPPSYDHKGRRSKGQRRLRRLPPQPCNPNRRDRPRDLSRATGGTIWIEEGSENTGTGRQGSAASIAVCARVPSVLVALVNDLSCRRVLHVTITMSSWSVACRAVSVRTGDASRRLD